MKEDHLESLTLEWLEGIGYSCLTGEDVSLGYQALAANESAVREMGHPVLRSLAVKLTDQIRKSSTINWQKRGDARARMRVMIKVLLKTHKYPPDDAPDALERVLNQAERLSDDWVFESA